MASSNFSVGIECKELAGTYLKPLAHVFDLRPVIRRPVPLLLEGVVHVLDGGGFPPLQVLLHPRDPGQSGGNEALLHLGSHRCQRVFQERGEQGIGVAEYGMAQY